MESNTSVVNTLLSNAIFESQIDALINFKTFACKQEDVDEDFVAGLIDAFITKMRTDFKHPKTKSVIVGRRKRCKSVYSLFIQYLMKDEDFKASHNNASSKVLLTEAVNMWKSLETTFKTKMRSLHKQNPTMSGKELYFNTMNSP